MVSATTASSTSRPAGRRRIALGALILATMPAVTIGVATEVAGLFGGGAPGTLTMPLVALPLACLLLVLAVTDIAGRRREVNDLSTLADRVAMRLEAVVAPTSDPADVVTSVRLASSERRTRLLTESAIDAVISTDELGRVVGWNPAATSLFGWDASEAVELTLDDIIPDRDGQPGWRDLVASLDRVVARRRDGAILVVEVSVAAYEDEGRQWYTAFVRDMTERAEAERRALASEASYRSLVEHLPGVVYTAQVGRWVAVDYASPQLAELLGYEPGELVGVPGMWQEHIHPDDRDRVLAEAAQDVADGATTRPDREYRMRRRDGREIWVRDHAVLELDADGRASRWHGFVADITERKRLEAELVRLAFHDPLTGLANRALLNDRVGHALARSERDTGAVAVLLIDIDDFKRVNDAHGHEAGDRLLVAIARRLREVCRAGATIARLGGDEFAVLVEDLASVSDATAVAQRLVDSFSEPVRLDGLTIGVRASVGVAIDVSQRRTGAWLMRAADLAMYDAKALGKGRWSLYNPSAHLASAKRLVLEGELRRAVEHRQFTIHYQPVCELGTGRIVGSEALLRWVHPRRGLVGPVEFIPLLESSGLIEEVGRWVVDDACRQAAAWSAQLAAPHWVAVNVSAAQLRDGSFVPFVADTMARHGLGKGLLTIEITESLALDSSPETTDLLRRLQELGTRIAVDDFGTGYSSLAYLRRLPIDRIKIDRSFVEGVGTDPEATAVARVIVELARSLRLSTVAEGIETQVQAQALAALGCELGQGFLLGRPMPPSALGALVGGRSAAHGVVAAP